MNRSFAVLSLALLLLTGCSGADKSQDAAGSVSPASSASVSASADSAGSSGGQADASSSSSASSTSTEAKPAPTFGPNHQELELTAEEQTAYQAGEYVPATEKHPALNVPVPVMPEKAKERSYEGAVAFVEYWNETENYATYTGDVSISKQITEVGWESQVNLLDGLAQMRRLGQWYVGSETKVETSPNGFVNEFENYYDLIFVYTRSQGKIYVIDSTDSADSPPFNSTNQPLTATLVWTSTGWKMNDITGIEGVEYEPANKGLPS